MAPANWVDAEPYHYSGTLQEQQQGVEEDGSGAGGGDGDGDGDGEARSLWIGGLLDWMDEDYLYSCFTRSPELLSVVIKRSKQSRQPEGYGFLNFSDHDVADQILHSYNGQKMPNANRDFKLNWAANPGTTSHDADSENCIFVGDLAYDVTDYMLYNVFRSRYPSVNCAKVIWDKVAARSKGYGFVTFGDVNERRQAMTEMNGAYCSTRRMRIGAAPNNKGFGASGTDSDRDPNNTRLFVGGLDQSMTCEDLEKAFGPYGEIVAVYVVAGKSCGFVTYSSRASAEEAMRILDGSQLGGKTVKISWGRPPPNKQGNTNMGHLGYADYQQQQSHETTVQVQNSFAMSNRESRFFPCICFPKDK